MRRIATIGMLATFVLAGCGSGTGDGPGGGDGPTSDDDQVTSSDGAAAGGELAGRAFVATEITDRGAAHELVEGTEVALDFRESEVTARAGCNTILGSYEIDGSTLAYTGGGTTEMGCDPELHAQDEWLQEFLESQPEIADEGDTVVLSSGKTVMTLVDRSVAHPPLPLEETTWTVDSIYSAESVSSTPSGATATLVFDGEGTVAVEPGCNTGSGSYELDGDTLVVRDIVSTMMACEGAEGDLEDSVLAVLNAGELSVTIEGDSLTLMAGDDGLGLRGEEQAGGEG